MLALLLLAAAPQLTVTPSEIKLNDRVVLSPIRDEAYLNLPELEEVLRAEKAKGPVEVHFTPEVRFRLAKRVMFSAASVGSMFHDFFVGERGPLKFDGDAARWANARVSGQTPPEKTLSELRAADAGTETFLYLEDDVTMGQLAEIMERGTAGGLRVRGVAPASRPDGTPVRMPQVGRSEPMTSQRKAALQKSINSHLREVTQCFEAEQTERPDLSGKLVVEFYIDAEGEVRRARGAKVEGLPQRMVDCITKSALTWKFQPFDSGGGLELNYPFTFKVAEPTK